MAFPNYAIVSALFVFVDFIANSRQWEDDGAGNPPEYFWHAVDLLDLSHQADEISPLAALFKRNRTRKLLMEFLYDQRRSGKYYIEGIGKHYAVIAAFCLRYILKSRRCK